VLRIMPTSDDARRAELARLAIDSMEYWVAVLDPSGTVLLRTQAAAKGTGLPNPDAIGRPFWELPSWTNEGAQRARQAIAAAAAGESVHFEALVNTPVAGRSFLIDCGVRPIEDAQGRIAYLLVEGTNITETRRAQDELARTNAELRGLYEKLQELDRLKTRFFANVSHELRTPLTLILGLVDRLQRAEGLTAAQRHDLAVTEANARLLLRHVKDLLDLSKLDAGRLAPSYRRVDFARLVRVTASLFEVMSQERGIRYTIDAPEPVTAEVDVDQVERILSNLLSNAFKFTPSGGEVRCALTKTDERVVLEVADSGPGIGLGLRERIFERFFQSEESARRSAGGTGLGLSITREFVHLHGGSVAVGESQSGGASFVVRLPLRAPPGAEVERTIDESERRPVAVTVAARTDAPPGAAAALADERPLVLVVEDHPDMNRFLAETLGERYRVVTALDGEDGLAKATALRPDLVLTDVMMPRMGGDQLVRALRGVPELAGVPLVLLTAKADDELAARLLREGAQDYVVKPFSAEELLARVRNLIAIKRARERLQREADSQREDLEALAAEVALRKRELADALGAVRRLGESAVLAHEEERRRLSLALHDGAGQVLSALANHLDEAAAQAGGEGLPRRMAHLRTLVLTLHDDLRRLSHGLRPLALDLGLVEALRDLAESASTDSLRVEIAAEPPRIDAPDDVALAVFRIAQAALANVALHAAAHNARLRLCGDGATLRLHLEDDGIGFDPNSRTSGLGLLGMRERAAWLGGTFHLDTAPGRGTRLGVVIPLVRGGA
jgi:PAS domain S-box-containing protein